MLVDEHGRVLNRGTEKAERAGAGARLGDALDQLIGIVAPRAALRRAQARVARDVLVRHYEGAAKTRRTQGWKQPIGDANAVIGPSLSSLRSVARDLVRNNPNARGALRTIVNHVVGTGITAKPQPMNKRVAELWRAWAETPACDSDGRQNLYGLQKLVMRTVVESGEVLIRRRLRRPDDGLPIPLQLQVLDPDHIDTLRHGVKLLGGSRIIHGIEYDVLGRRTAYWLFPDHPGSDVFATRTNSVRVPAEGVIHVFCHERPGQVRGPSWFSSCLLKWKDEDDFEDATLVKQKVAACLAVIISDLDGSGLPLGNADTTKTPQIDSLEPGWIGHVPQGTEVDTVAPPTVREFGDYTKTTLRAIASGLGVSYEALTGDYSNVNFSSARMARLEHSDSVEDWRWNMLIPQFCAPVWGWAMQAAAVMGLVDAQAPEARWTAPPLPMLEPDKEGEAATHDIRSGLKSHREVLRERGYDPDEVLDDVEEWNAELDRRKIVFDSDPRMTTQQGLPREQAQAATANPDAGAGDGNDETKPPAKPKPANGEAAEA